MLAKVISGGQTGADQGALRAAQAAGVPTGGWAPRGWLVESPDGNRDVAAPWLAPRFGLVECAELGYPPRTRANARDSDGTLWFGNPDTSGAYTTLEACRELGRPVLLVVRGRTRPSDVAAWIAANDIKVLNVAGNRESKAPGIGARVERFLADVFRRLAEAG